MMGEAAGGFEPGGGGARPGHLPGQGVRPEFGRRLGFRGG